MRLIRDINGILNVKPMNLGVKVPCTGVNLVNIHYNGGKVLHVLNHVFFRVHVIKISNKTQAGRLFRSERERKNRRGNLFRFSHWSNQ